MDTYSKKYSDQYALRQFETVLVSIRRRQVLRSLGQYSHQHILEVGCGMEPLFEYVDDFTSFTVVEPSQDFAIEAMAKRGNREDITIIQGSLEEESENLATRDFDFIVVSSLLHEVPDPEELLTGVGKLCRPWTTVHVNVPNVFSFHRLLAYEAGLITGIFDKSATETKFHRHTRFDKSALFELVQSRGFRVLDFGTYFIKPFTHDQMDRLIECQLLNHSLIEGLEKMIKYMPEMGCEMFVELVKEEDHGIGGKETS